MKLLTVSNIAVATDLCSYAKFPVPSAGNAIDVMPFSDARCKHFATKDLITYKHKFCSLNTAFL